MSKSAGKTPQPSWVQQMKRVKEQKAKPGMPRSDERVFAPVPPAEPPQKKPAK